MDLSGKEHGMKFLLVAVNAKYIHSNPAVYSLYAYSKEKYAQSMEIVEFTINQKTEDILAQLYEETGCHRFFLLYLELGDGIRSA